MKANKLFWALASVFAVFALSSCEPKPEPEGPDTPGTEDVPGGEEEEEEEFDPADVEAPGEGSILFLVDATEVNACNGLAIEGNFCGYDPSNGFKGEEQAPGWYTIEMSSMTAEEFGNAKILLLLADGTSSWDYQVASSGYDITGAEEYITLIDDYGTQNAINLASDEVDNVVIPVKILAIQDDNSPCGEVEEVPAGSAKFIFTMEGDCPAEEVIFTGAFEELSWGDSDRIMTKQEDGTYVWEGAYPANFQFKVIAMVGGSQVWLNGGNQKVTAESGAEIAFSGCFEGYCPVEEEEVPAE